MEVREEGGGGDDGDAGFGEEAEPGVGGVVVECVKEESKVGGGDVEVRGWSYGRGREKMLGDPGTGDKGFIIVVDVYVEDGVSSGLFDPLFPEKFVVDLVFVADEETECDFFGRRIIIFSIAQSGQ